MNKQEKTIKAIIDRYGDKINLQKHPHVIIEIIRQFGPEFDPGRRMECLPPGGPPPKKGSDVILIGDLAEQIEKIASEIKRLHKKVDKLKK